MGRWTSAGFPSAPATGQSGLRRGSRNLTDRRHVGVGNDEAAEVDRIATRLREIVARDLRKRGLVVAVSGGIDSSVSAALAVHALGCEKVFGLLLPERDSSAASTERGRLLVEHLGIDYAVEDIAATLQAIGCYRPTARSPSATRRASSGPRAMGVRSGFRLLATTGVSLILGTGTAMAEIKRIVYMPWPR